MFLYYSFDVDILFTLNDFVLPHIFHCKFGSIPSRQLSRFTLSRGKGQNPVFSQAQCSQVPFLSDPTLQNDKRSARRFQYSYRIHAMTNIVCVGFIMADLHSATTDIMYLGFISCYTFHYDRHSVSTCRFHRHRVSRIHYTVQLSYLPLRQTQCALVSIQRSYPPLRQVCLGLIVLSYPQLRQAGFDYISFQLF